ncbi:hypothetical protein ACLKA7_001462 [Drosophila subpalustris]
MFNQRYTANELLVFLGRHNLKNWNEEGSLAAPVDGIYIHSDYNKQIGDYDADIAVLILKDEVRFNTFIQPVCLWSGSSRTEYIVGEHAMLNLKPATANQRYLKRQSFQTTCALSQTQTFATFRRTALSVPVSWWTPVSTDKAGQPPLAYLPAFPALDL